MMVTEEKVIDENVGGGEDVKPSMIIRKKHHPDVLSYFREEITERRTRWHEKTAIMLTSRLQFEEQVLFYDIKIVFSNMCTFSPFISSTSLFL